MLDLWLFYTETRQNYGSSKIVLVKNEGKRLEDKLYAIWASPPDSLRRYMLYCPESHNFS